MDKIRNLCIIAHIDHGKSTLADRFLEVTGTVEKRKMRQQLLDTMELERERGITIKLQPVRMRYKGYVLNLIDTPGHVDFSYEVSRSLAAVEGAILLVDASQGIEAQTLAHLHLARGQGLTIIPAVNKVDLPGADKAGTKRALSNLLGVEEAGVLEVSGKTGAGVEVLLDAVVEQVPPPRGRIDRPLRALVFDSVFDKYKGVIAYVRIVDGEIKAETKITMMASQSISEVLEVGTFAPQLTKTKLLSAGEIGYVATGLREVSQVRVGDTITLADSADVMPLTGYKKVLPFVYAGIFTVDNNDYPKLRDALQRLSLNDSALVYEPENSPALGFGFRCGFLGLLHLEIVKERLEREFDLNLIATTPSVSYRVELTDGKEALVSNPTELPLANKIKTIAEPWVSLEILSPARYLGSLMEILQNRRGVQKNIEHLDKERVLVTYEVPLGSIIVDFYDQLKSISSGYASMNYIFLEYRAGDLVKVDVLVGGSVIDALSVIVDKPSAQRVGKMIVAKLKEVVPKQNFKIALQAAIGSKIIARDDIAPYRKDVLAKLYGGDRTRKDKLLEKQKKGKKRLKMVGKVEIPQDAFLKLLS
ncbi:elongation factor 4 [candidate division Kazan bacterium RBG_13_50_9]|uniref:Elongation factor 4 n=1 Tax=candidate division Kazan bacterium RBG_13_50_9 TaxID=1798535 RepID=A0A1F4NS92_UNCK3|nr:MAG: elongation factor 4 [candidate division Kazan bacterium RBG_13_50_9]